MFPNKSLTKVRRNRGHVKKRDSWQRDIVKLFLIFIGVVTAVIIGLAGVYLYFLTLGACLSHLTLICR